MRQLFLAVVLFSVIVPGVRAEIKTEYVEYTSGDTTMKGYIAHDDSITDKRPGVLVVHEWWGQDDYARSRAYRLAKLGYTAMAVDMYGGGKTVDHPKTAGELSGEIRKNWEMGKARFMSAYNVLTKHITVDSSRMGAMGSSFGGSVVLQMARAGVDLDGVVSFYGNLSTSTPAQKDTFKPKVLVYNGALDSFVSSESIVAFNREMTAANVDYQIVSLEGAQHSFSNPGSTALGKKFNLPLAYNAQADKKSWAGMTAFFKKVFAQ
ncbi:MAG: dienelactone hydrolase family protein [Gammaproteobacteria bacterium]|nr:dienelactone hydrolase family protein [Gammaproteobacteria bacterium]